MRLGHGNLAVAQAVDAADAFVLAFAAENAALRDEVDRALEAIRADGRYDELWDRWFGEGVTPESKEPTRPNYLSDEVFRMP